MRSDPVIEQNWVASRVPSTDLLDAWRNKRTSPVYFILGPDPWEDASTLLSGNDVLDSWGHRLLVRYVSEVGGAFLRASEARIGKKSSLVFSSSP